MVILKPISPLDHSLPSPPFVPVSGIPNFRDLGGHFIPPTSVNPAKRQVRTQLIYRSAEPSQITQEGIAAAQALGITKAYDLRSIPEIEKAKKSGYGAETEWEGCKRVFVPVFQETDYSPASLAIRFRNYASDGTEGYTAAYTDIMEFAPASYSVILRHIAEKPEEPFIVHCTAGKDRTGVICALILSLCGVDDDTITDEYALTEIGLSREWKETVIAHLRENYPGLKENEAGAWNMISAKKENMAAFLKVIEEKYGGAEKYVVERCGLSVDEVEAIRKNLIVNSDL